MKMLIKIVASVLLLYAIPMLFIEGLYSLLSVSPQTNMRALIEEILIPYLISIISMVYCIFRIWSHSVWTSYK